MVKAVAGDRVHVLRAPRHLLASACGVLVGSAFLLGTVQWLFEQDDLSLVSWIVVSAVGFAVSLITLALGLDGLLTSEKVVFDRATGVVRRHRRAPWGRKVEEHELDEFVAVSLGEEEGVFSVKLARPGEGAKSFDIEFCWLRSTAEETGLFLAKFLGVPFERPGETGESG